MAQWPWFWVALGSAIGGVGRYWTGQLIDSRYTGALPLGTLAANVAGSMLIGLLASWLLADGRGVAGLPIREFLMIGVLGGFTTFSSFSLQSLSLMQSGAWMTAMVYITGSVLLCLLGVWLGHSVGTMLAR